MDNALHDEDLLICYLDGELNASEKLAVEQRLQTDADFRNRYQNLLVAVQAVKHLGTTQQVAGIHQEMMKELNTEKPTGVVFRLSKVVRYTMAVAASVLILFIGVRLFLNAQPSADGIYNNTFVDFNVANTRGAENNLSPIEAAYQKSDFNAVTSAVRTVNLTAKDSLLIGLSYLHQNKIQSAINWFKTLADSPTDYRQDAEFYLSLSYLKDKSYAQSLAIMKKIHGNPLHIYHDQLSDETIEKVQKLIP